MILCAVDDLIFSIKISTAAKGLGADVFFERNPDAVIDRIREKQPSLVILDLNSRKMRPLDVVRVLRADEELRSTRTLGFVQHTDAEVIAAAREAGIDRVMARSAFVTQLEGILTSP